MQRVIARRGRCLACFHEVGAAGLRTGPTMKRAADDDRPKAGGSAKQKKYWVGEKKFFKDQDKPSMQEMAMRRMRQKLAWMQRYDMPSPKFQIKVLGTGSMGCPACLFVSTDHSKYLFNCGEGTQCNANEHRCRMTRLRHVFITTPSWRNLGGLAGTFLNLQAIGIEDVYMHGPAGISEISNAINKFAALPRIRVHSPNDEEESVYEDANITIRLVRLKHGTKEAYDKSYMIVDTTSFYGPSRKHRMLEEPDRYIAKVRVDRINEVVCYVCTRKPVPGPLQVEKCKEMGLEPGPSYGLLKKGIPVTLPNGKVIKKDDVCEDLPEQTFLVVDCPSEDYLPIFLEKMAPERMDEMCTDYALMGRIFHFSPDRIIDAPEYQAWMKAMDERNPDVQHIYMNRGNRGMGSVATYAMQMQLNKICPEFFPLLNDDCFKIDEAMENPENKVFRPRCMHSFWYHGQRTPDEKTEQQQLTVAMPSAAELTAFLEDEEFIEEHRKMREAMEALNAKLGDCPEYPKLQMLGTGCSVPNKVRNTSGILIWHDEDYAILLDCGESTLAQIVKFYGALEAKNVLKKIKVIYVSHLHADHHIGLVSLLLERQELTAEPITLLAPARIAEWLHYYSARYDSISQAYNLVDNNQFLGKFVHKKPFMQQMAKDLGLQDLRMTYARHPADATAVSLTLRNGMRVVYSGDTMPCSNVIHLSRGCDLLIHEATMDDDLIEDAARKLHSTTRQAINVGYLAQVKFLLLTHFSQRYAKIPRLPNCETEETPIRLDNVAVAYDHMVVPLSRLSLLPLMYPCLKIVYKEQYDEQEVKTMKRKFLENLAKELRQPDSPAATQAKEEETTASGQAGAN